MKHVQMHQSAMWGMEASLACASKGHDRYRFDRFLSACVIPALEESAVRRSLTAAVTSKIDC